APGQVGREIAAAGTNVLTLGMSEKPRLTELVSAALGLARVIDARRIDLVQSFLYRANVLARIAGRLSRSRPVVVAGQHGLRPLTGRRAALAARWTSRLSDRTVAVSRAVR